MSTLSDAEFASQHPDCRSVSGFLIYLGTSLINWASKKQTLVALSTAEPVEYYALLVVVQEVAYLKVLMEFLGHPSNGPTTMYVDSTSAKAIAKRLSETKKQKSIDVRYHYTQSFVERGQIEIAYIPTDAMTSDALTKPLSRELFEKHRRSMLGMFLFVLTNALLYASRGR